MLSYHIEEGSLIPRPIAPRGEEPGMRLRGERIKMSFMDEATMVSVEAWNLSSQPISHPPKSAALTFLGDGKWSGFDR